MRKCIVACALFAGVALLAAGCGEKASTDQPMDQVRADAAKMSVDDLKAKVELYKGEIAKYQAQLSDLADQAKKVTNPLSEEAKKIATQTSDINAMITKLQERLQAYVGELAKKGQ